MRLVFIELVAFGLQIQWDDSWSIKQTIQYIWSFCKPATSHLFIYWYNTAAAAAVAVTLCFALLSYVKRPPVRRSRIFLHVMFAVGGLISHQHWSEVFFGCARASQKVWKDLFTVGSASQPFLGPSPGPAFMCFLTDTVHLGTYNAKVFHTVCTPCTALAYHIQLHHLNVLCCDLPKTHH